MGNEKSACRQVIKIRGNRDLVANLVRYDAQGTEIAQGLGIGK